jgi:hypothetical protein
MKDENIQEILGRPYKRKPKAAGEALEDGLTRVWLQQNDSRQCSNCGIWMVREDGDDTEAVMCLCGWCYCWTCNEDGDDCGCDHAEFYDNLMDETVNVRDGREHLVATAEDLDDFGAFLERREAVWVAKSEEETKPVPVEEPAEAYLVALFEEYTEEAEADFIPILEWVQDHQFLLGDIGAGMVGGAITLAAIPAGGRKIIKPQPAVLRREQTC